MQAQDCSCAEFIEQFEKRSQPCIIQGLVEKWVAHQKWSSDWFAHRHPKLRLKCGDDSDGDRAYMTPYLSRIGCAYAHTCVHYDR